MIKNFYIENFQSVKERLSVSFVASALTDDTSYQNYFNYKGESILKAAAFYGMNASGKSAIVRALAVFRELISPSIPLSQPTNELPHFPFKFSDETKHKPTYFGIEFSLDNTDSSSTYKYSLCYDRLRIIDERLEKMTSQKYSVLFFRHTSENGATQLDFGSNATNVPLLTALKPSVVPYKPFLSIFSTLNIPDLHDSYLFFSERLINISPEVTRNDDIVPIRVEQDDNLKAFLVSLLKTADFNIDSFHVGKSKLQNIINGMPNLLAEKKSLFLDHNVKNEDNSIEFIQESLGTKKMVVLGAHLYDALKKPSVLIVDELEASLHPELTKMIVTLFLDDSINTHNSQLVFTSHETTLLNLSLLRRDQINFVYKDENSCGTYVKSLKDFQMRKDSSIAKSYLAGRFSTSPEVNENLLIKGE